MTTKAIVVSQMMLARILHSHEDSYRMMMMATMMVMTC